MLRTTLPRPDQTPTEPQPRQHLHAAVLQRRQLPSRSELPRSRSELPKAVGVPARFLHTGSYHEGRNDNNYRKMQQEPSGPQRPQRPHPHYQQPPVVSLQPGAVTMERKRKSSQPGLRGQPRQVAPAQTGLLHVLPAAGLSHVRGGRRQHHHLRQLHHQPRRA